MEEGKRVQTEETGSQKESRGWDVAVRCSAEREPGLVNIAAHTRHVTTAGLQGGCWWAPGSGSRTGVSKAPLCLNSLCFPVSL